MGAVQSVYLEKLQSNSLEFGALPFPVNYLAASTASVAFDVSAVSVAYVASAASVERSVLATR